jgi:hypothetical protein
MADVKGKLTKKVGPLPVWGWIAAGGGVFILYYYEHNKSSSTASAAAPAATDSGTVTPDTSGSGIDTSGITGTPGADTGYTPGSGTHANRQGAGQTAITDALSALPAQIAAALQPQSSTGTPSSSNGTVAGLGGIPINTVPIKTQLQWLASGQISQGQLGPAASKVLAAAGGNVKKAIASRSTAAATAHPSALSGSAAAKAGTSIASAGGAVQKIASGSNGSAPAAVAPSSHSPTPANTVTVVPTKPPAENADQLKAAKAGSNARAIH